jgi:hypothetical protein
MTTSHSAPQRQGFWQQLCDAFFLDLPFLVDSRWRHCEYSLSRNHDYRVHRADDTQVATLKLRSRHRNAAFVLLLITLVFMTYGPTFAAICGTGGAGMSRILYGGLSLLFAVGCLLIIKHAPRGAFGRCSARLDEVHAGRVRRCALRLLTLLVVCVGVVVCTTLSLQAYREAFDPLLCQSAQFHWRSVAQALLIVTAVIGAYVLARAQLRSNAFARWQSALIVSVWVFSWWWLATPEAREADGLPYRQSFTLFAALLFAMTWLAAPLSKRLFRSVTQQTCDDFSLALRHTELFVERPDPEMSARRLINALVNGPLYHPLHLLFLPSLVAVMASNDWLWSLCLVAFLFSGLLITWGFISVRWEQMLMHIDRWFFTGTPLVISLGVIGLAIARLVGNQYVTTLLGAASFGVIFMWILMTYAGLWLFEQVINHALGPQLLRILDRCKLGEPDYIDYPASDIVQPLADKEHRYITLHGAGRLAIVGLNADRTRQFHTYSATELFTILASHSDVIEHKLPAQSGLYSRLTESSHDIARRIKLFFNVLNLGVLLLCGAFLWYIRGNDQHQAMLPMVEAQWQPATIVDSPQHFDLTSALIDRANQQRPALIVAASGGGTRAAVYTASAMRGLAQLGLADDIVLMSGVSGGGVALAYYAMNKPMLPTAAAFAPEAWRYYRDQMAEPFIQDVLEGSLEWRIAGRAPLSALLSESFERRLKHSNRRTLGDVHDVGLILNTSITGHPPSDSNLVSNVMDSNRLQTDPHDCLPFSFLSGQRLSFTNLADTQHFPRPAQTRLPDVGFSFVLINDPRVELVRAAALNANFPPVFPNARVDLIDGSPDCGGRRVYHVTDGGATENLGLISALYALQSSLDVLAEKKSSGTSVTLPPIHIVAMEASAIDVDYKQDRGIGTATGGSKERLAGGLTELLLINIESRLAALAGEPTKLHIHFLPMPAAFRSRGGVGTHWMLPRHVNITNPHLPTAPGFTAQLPLADGDDAINVRLSKHELFDVLDDIHDADGGFCTKPSARTARPQRVADWICGVDSKHPTAPDFHVLTWRRLVTAMQ